MKQPTLTRDEYLAFRRRYQPAPENIALVIVAESPPASGLYFYKADGRCTEPLFKAMMEQLDYAPANKDQGLREFQRRGWVLVDATYRPVNKLANRDAVIERDYPALCDDLKELMRARPVPVVLVKANVCRLLGPRLMRDGFNVLNGAVVIPFPSTGQQKNFHLKFAAVLRRGRR